MVRFIVPGLLLLVTALVVGLVLSQPTGGSPSAAPEATPKTGTPNSLQPEESDGRTEALRVDAGDRPTQGNPTDRPPQLRIVEDMLGPSLGSMSADDMKRAKLTIDSLHDASTSELKAFQELHQGEYDAKTAADEASLLRTALLWEAAREALEHGDYWIGFDYPSRLPQSTGAVHYQDLSVTKDGKPATAVFFINNGTIAGGDFVGATDYFRSQEKFLLQEAAYRFNSLPDSERAALYKQYKDAVAANRVDKLSPEIATRFPLGVQVDESTLVMHAPR